MLVMGFVINKSCLTSINYYFCLIQDYYDKFTMHKSLKLFFAGLVFSSVVKAQLKDDTLLSINNKPIEVSEFKKVYLKNIDLVKDESQKDVDEYLRLFINYKLKLEEAKTLGLDQQETYKKELDGYKKQLASGYLTDTEATDALVKEAYNRLQQRVNASHILIRLAPDASPADTLTAYERITEARAKVTGGAEFTEVAKQYSEDPSAAQNGGDMGWFSAFRMVYPFESAAYATSVGDVSQPFKTQFGYHILKVNKKEKVEGEVEVAHIMIAVDKMTSMEQAEQKIKQIETQLKNGASFESLAKQFSDDRNTARNGGKINKFGKGALNSEKFENVAFSLTAQGEISQPIQTQYGWHLLKMIKRYPPKSFEEQKTELTNMIKRDSRSKLISDSFIKSLQEKYRVNVNEQTKVYFTEQFKKGKNVEDILKDNSAMALNVFSINDKGYTYQDFAEYIKPRQAKLISSKDKDKFVEAYFESFVEDSLLRYYEANLERDNEDYADVLNEYRDGLLLFDLMESKIWNAAKEDTIALKTYYEQHKAKYKKELTYRIIKASAPEKEQIQRLIGNLKSGKNYKAIKEELSAKDSQILVSEVEVDKNDETLKVIKKPEAKSYAIEQLNNFYTLVYINEEISPYIQSFDEVKGAVINDYQDDLEKQWLKELRAKYKVEVNTKILKKVKKELN